MPSINHIQKNRYFALATKIVVGTLLCTIFLAPLSGLIPVARAVAPEDTPLPLPPPVPPPESATAVTPASTPTGETTASKTNSGDKAKVDNSSSGYFSTFITNIVYVFTVGLMSILAYVGGWILDVGVQLSLQSVTYSQLFVSEAWAAVRDLANMVFIFLIVYLAITIVLRAETSNSLRLLGGIILSALLINFSFFITRTVIDTGNILATQFYNAIEAPSLADTANGTTHTPTQINGLIAKAGKYKDLTANVMNLVGVQTLLSPGSFSSTFQSSNNWLVNIIVFSFVYIAMGAFLALLAFTFISVGIKFLIRIVVLWLVIIASPLAFVSKALFIKDKNDALGFFKKWSSALVEFSFYPAIFLFIFLMINQFAIKMSGCSAKTLGDCPGLLNSAFANLDSGGAFLIPIASAVASIGVRLGLIVIMFYYALNVSDKIGNTGIKFVDGLGKQAAHKMTDWTKSYGGWAARRPAAAAGGLLYRNTVAKGARGIGNSLSNAKWANKDNFGGRLAYNARKNLINPVAEKKFLGTQSLSDVKKYTDERKKDIAKYNNTVKNKENATKLAAKEAEFDASRYAVLLQKQATLNPQETIEFDKLTEKQKDITALKQSTNNLTKAEVESSMTAKNIADIIKHVNDPLMKRIEESEKYSAEERATLRAEWHAKSDDAPLQKAQKQIELLRKLHEDLKKINANFGIGEFDTHTKAGAPMNSRALQEMTDALKNKIGDIADPDNTSITQKDRAKAREHIRDIKIALSKIGEEVGKAPITSSVIVK